MIFFMPKTPSTSLFSSFGLSATMISAIKRARYEKPTEVQTKAIPPIIEGRDVLAGAETGSGKTAAFALPLLDKLILQKQAEGAFAAKGNQVRSLILVPTRELAIQINDEISAYAERITPKIRVLSVFGGVKINPQMKALRGGADVLVATPGRLLDLHSQNAIKFNKLQTLVLDEVDRLVGEGFKDEIEAIFKLLPNKRQNLVFTATYPDSIRYLIRRLLKRPIIINIDPSADALIDQRVFTVNYDNKNALLAYLLNEYDWKQILVFCSAKKSCDNLVRKLESRGITAVAMHGNKEQRARAKALREFKQGKIRVLIATDVAARGLDIEQLPCVINFELPRSPKDYIHRIGRTGRAGEFGFAISLIAHHEYAHFSVIEKHCDIQLEREQIEGFEASDVAPPMPARSTPKKKSSKRLSKKKKRRLQEKKEKAKIDNNIAPQRIKEPLEDRDIKLQTRKSPVSQPKSNTANRQGIRKGQVAAIPHKAKQAESQPQRQQSSEPWSKTKPKRRVVPEQKKTVPTSPDTKQSDSENSTARTANANIWGDVIKRKKNKQSD